MRKLLERLSFLKASHHALVYIWFVSFFVWSSASKGSQYSATSEGRSAKLLQMCKQRRQCSYLHNYLACYLPINMSQSMDLAKQCPSRRTADNQWWLHVVRWLYRSCSNAQLSSWYAVGNRRWAYIQSEIIQDRSQEAAINEQVLSFCFKSGWYWDNCSIANRLLGYSASCIKFMQSSFHCWRISLLGPNRVTDCLRQLEKQVLVATKYFFGLFSRVSRQFSSYKLSRFRGY